MASTRDSGVTGRELRECDPGIVTLFVEWTAHLAPAEAGNRYTVRWESNTDPNGIVYEKNGKYEAWEPYGWGGPGGWAWGCRATSTFETLEEAQAYLERYLISELGLGNRGR